jgi:putative addiction module component (TIGR02574 family)
MDFIAPITEPGRTRNGRSLDTESGRASVPSVPLTLEELAEIALELPAESRARLAELLVESLDTAEPSDIDRAWAAEAKRRAEELQSGQAEPIPAEEALRRARNSLKR